MIFLRMIIANLQIALKKLFLFAIALELFYVLATSLFLNTPIFDKALNFDPRDFFVRFESGWSVIPGLVKSVKNRKSIRPKSPVLTSKNNLFISKFQFLIIFCDSSRGETVFFQPKYGRTSIK